MTLINLKSWGFLACMGGLFYLPSLELSLLVKAFCAIVLVSYIIWYCKSNYYEYMAENPTFMIDAQSAIQSYDHSRKMKKLRKKQEKEAKHME